jgi:hypothetical protein
VTRPPAEVEEKVRHVFTCSVGKRRSHASFYVQNSDMVGELLARIAGIESEGEGGARGDL